MDVPALNSAVNAETISSSTSDEHYVYHTDILHGMTYLGVYHGRSGQTHVVSIDINAVVDIEIIVQR